MEQNEERNIKIYGTLFIILGIWDFIQLALSYFSGTFDIESISSQSGTSIEMAKAVVVIIAIITILIALVKIFIGYRGVTFQKEKGLSKGFTKFITFILVILVIGLVLSIMGYVGKTVEFGSLLDDLISVTIVGGFLHSIKKVNE